ncbi:MAG: PKD domain-containing protein, partial [Sphingobacteriales bacterium]
MSGFTSVCQTADFSINVSSGCVPLSGVNFTDISSGGTVISRNWNLGNGTIINNGPATVGTNYLLPGTFNVTLTATFTGGIIRTVSKNVIVHPKPVANFSSNDTAGCITHNAAFTDLSSTSTGTITNWQWDLGAGGSTNQNPTFSYTNPGSYQVSLIVRNSWGCSSEAASRPAFIRVYNRPTASFNTNANSSCTAPFTVQFNNTTTGAGPITYEWDFGDGSPTSTVTNPSHTYNAFGVYRVRLTARIGNNCSHSVTTNFYTDIYVGTPTAAIASPDTVCVGNTILFSGSSTPAGLGYYSRWLFSDDGATSGAASVNHVFDNPGDFVVRYISSTYYGCADTVYKNIHVKPGPVVDFSADRTRGCSLPFTTNFTSITTPTTGLAYVWNFGDGNTSTDPNPSHTYTYAGNFTVRLTVTDTSIVDGCSATIVKNSYIQIRIPTINFTFVPPVGCRPLPVVATATIGSMVEALDYLIWNWGDGTIDTIRSGSLIGSHIYTTAGTFNIQVSLVTVSSCQVSSIVRPVTVIN